MGKVKNTINPVEYVAEIIFGYKRGACYGSTGGGNISIQDGETKSSYFFYCQWCGERIDNGHLPQTTCPKFPFPEFGIIDLMRKLGERNIGIRLRYDPTRDKNNFTLIGPLGRICDTDEPLRALCEWVMPDNRELTEDEIERGKELESLALECLRSTATNFLTVDELIADYHKHTAD